MASQLSDEHAIKWLLRLVVPLFDSHLVTSLTVLWRLGKRIIARKSHEGMYKVLSYTAELELKDAKGRTASLRKQQKVRFLQDNIIAYEDKAWGDSEIFADYQCSPGVAVDRYQEGHRYLILISLRETKQRDDTEEFHIERTIKNGFTKASEYFQTDIDHITQHFSISIIFPKNRLPKQVLLVEKNTTRTIPLGPEHQTTLPDGRYKVTWNTGKPRLFEAYILRWEW